MSGKYQYLCKILHWILANGQRRRFSDRFYLHAYFFCMPQLDKELFTEYFFVIAIVLLSLHSDYYVSENFLRLNSQWFLHNFFIRSRLMLNYEKKEFTSYVNLLVGNSVKVF